MNRFLLKNGLVELVLTLPVKIIQTKRRSTLFIFMLIINNGYWETGEMIRAEGLGNTPLNRNKSTRGEISRPGSFTQHPTRLGSNERMNGRN